jgi:hypothetical protein
MRPPPTGGGAEGGGRGAAGATEHLRHGVRLMPPNTSHGG